MLLLNKYMLYIYSCINCLWLHYKCAVQITSIANQVKYMNFKFNEISAGFENTLETKLFQNLFLIIDSFTMHLYLIFAVYTFLHSSFIYPVVFWCNSEDSPSETLHQQTEFGSFKYFIIKMTSARFCSCLHSETSSKSWYLQVSCTQDYSPTKINLPIRMSSINFSEWCQ